MLSQSTLGRRQSRATATNGLHSGAIATGPGPEAAGGDPVHEAVADGPDAGAAAATGPDAGAAAAAGPRAFTIVDPHRDSISQAELQTDQQPARLETSLLAHETVEQQMSNDSVQQLIHGQPYGQAQLPGLLPIYLPLVIPLGHGLSADAETQHPIWNPISSSAGLSIGPSQPAHAAVSPQPGVVLNPSATIAPQPQHPVIPGAHSQLPNQTSQPGNAQSPPEMRNPLLAPQCASVPLVPQQADQPNSQLSIPSIRLHSSPQLQAQALSRDQPSPQLINPGLAGDQSVIAAKAPDGSKGRTEAERSGGDLPVDGQCLSVEGPQLSAERQVSVGLQIQAPPAQAAKAEQQLLKAKREMMNTRSVKGNKAHNSANLQPVQGLAQRSDSAALSSAQSAGTRRSLRSSSGTAAAAESRGAVDAAAARAVSSGLAAPAVLPGSGHVSVSVPMAQLPYAPAAKAQHQTSETARPQIVSLGLTNAASLPHVAPSSSSGPSSSLDHRAAPGPAPIVTPRAAPSSVSSDAQPKSAASPVPSSGPNINPKSAPISVPSSGPSPVAGTSDPSRAAPTLQAAAPVLPKAASDASPKPLLRAASMSAPSTEPASAVLCSPPRPAPRQTPKPPPRLQRSML